MAVPKKRGERKFETELWAIYEIDASWISDDYTIDDASALELFDEWVTRVGTGDYRNGLIPIRWYVEPRPRGLPSYMPFANEGLTQGQKTFLDHFTWPTDAVTGDHVNWLTLPVLDQAWSRDRMTKGGFIQEATGWKPSMFQPFLRLSSLVDAYSHYRQLCDS